GSPRAPLDLPYPDGSLIKTPPCGQPFAETLRPYIGPVLLDVVQTSSAVRLAVYHPPPRGNIGERRPEAVLLLVVDQNEKTAIFVVERIDAHQFSRPSTQDVWNVANLTGAHTRGLAFRQSSCM